MVRSLVMEGRMLDAGHAGSAAFGAGVTLAVVLLMGFLPLAGRQAVLDVQRINIREPDGTLRMVLSNAATAPGIIVKGRGQPHPDRQSAGMLFYNDEGTENGGLIFDGRRDAGGARHSGGSLTFDRYEQDQVVQVLAAEDGDRRSAGLIVNDHPDQAMDFAAIERARGLPVAQQAAAYAAAHISTTRRVFLGRSDDGASQLVLKDRAGVDRLRLSVDAGGQPVIAFLDAKGKVARTIGVGRDR